MAVVASLQFVDLPSTSMSFLRKRLEDRPRWVFFCNTAYEDSRNTGLAVLAKTKRFLKAAQTEITQPLAHKISRSSWLQSPEIQLTFSAGSRQKNVAMVSRNITKMGTNLRRE